MSTYHENIIKALKDALPINKHPNKEVYTLEQLRALYVPDMACIECDEYGDAECICGHPIKYIYQVLYIHDRTISVSPVGSECINGFFESSEVILKAIIDNIDLKRLWNGEYTTKDFCKKTGFTAASMNYLDTYVLTKSEYAFLHNIVKARRKRYFTERQISFMYRIIKLIQKAYADLKRKQRDLAQLDDNETTLF